jgi:hypothetical protein
MNHLDGENIRAEASEGLLWGSGFERLKRPLCKLDAALDVDRLRFVAQQRQRDGVIAITFASREYLRIAIAWARSLRQMRWEHYVIIAADEETAAALEAANIPNVQAQVDTAGVPVNYRSPVGFSAKGLAITTMKYPVVSALITHGLNVIMSDADAIWLKNPLPHLQGDLAFQRIVYFPHALARIWGFAACSGFVYFRDCPATRILLQECVREQEAVQSDQVALNLALWGAGVQWQGWTFDCQLAAEQAVLKESLKASFAMTANRSVIGRALATGLDVLALPHVAFWRHAWVPFRHADVVVCHPNSPKDQAAKLGCFRRLGVCLADDDDCARETGSGD